MKVWKLRSDFSAGSSIKCILNGSPDKLCAPSASGATFCAVRENKDPTKGRVKRGLISCIHLCSLCVCCCNCHMLLCCHNWHIMMAQTPRNEESKIRSGPTTDPVYNWTWTHYPHPDTVDLADTRSQNRYNLYLFYELLKLQELRLSAEADLLDV